MCDLGQWRIFTKRTLHRRRPRRRWRRRGHRRRVHNIYFYTQSILLSVFILLFTFPLILFHLFIILVVTFRMHSRRRGKETPHKENARVSKSIIRRRSESKSLQSIAAFVPFLLFIIMGYLVEYMRIEDSHNDNKLWPLEVAIDKLRAIMTNLMRCNNEKSVEDTLGTTFVRTFCVLDVHFKLLWISPSYSSGRNRWVENSSEQRTGNRLKLC